MLPVGRKPLDSRQLRRGLGLAAVVWLAGLLAWQLPGADRLERELCLPWLFARRGPQPVPTEAVIFAIDAESARRLGLPSRFADWPRRVYADLIRRAAAGGAGVIALDVFFARARQGPDDAVLAAAIADAGNVVLFGNMQRRVQALPGAGADGQLQVDRLRRPYQPLAQAAAAVAPFVLPKAPARVDTVWTHHPAAPTLATLPAAAVLVQAGARPCAVASGVATAAQQAACGLATDLARGARERMLNFYGPPRSVSIVSAAQVLLGNLPDLTGRAVFIGHVEPYFPNQIDSFLTAVSRPDGLDLSGVEIATTAYLNLLRQEFLEPARSAWVAGGLLLAALLMSAACLPLRAPAVGAVCLLLVGVAYAGVLTAFARLHLWLPLVPWLAQILAVLLGTLALRARHSGRERAQVAAAFRHYLPAHVVERIAQDSGGALPGGQPAPIRAVCLVSDVAGYTTMAERLAANALSELMNQYYAALLAPIQAEGGIVTDIVGDSALALWPSGHTDMAQRLRACRAALGIQEVLTGFGLHGGLPTRVGLHVGELVLGSVGALDHYEYRAIGDAVNTASRIESLNKRLGTQVLASEAVISGLSGVERRPVGWFRLAGKAEPLALYQLLGTPTARQVAARPLYEAALAAFAAGDAKVARHGFGEALAVDPHDTVAAFYADFLGRSGDMLPPGGVIAVSK